MCNNHSENTTSELLSWLQDCKVKFTVNIIVTDMNLLRQNLSPELRAAWLNKNQESQNSNVSREMLQKGEASRMMTDDQITEFFTADMKKISPHSTVCPIPKGVPVFIFCVFEGKLGPIQSFIDNGANCWLSLDGIPQDHLTSVKLCDGPITLGAASYH